MKQLFLSIIIGILIYFAFSYFLVFTQSTETTINQGYINFISETPTGTLGALLGAIIASYFSFTPSFVSYIKKIKSRRKEPTLKNTPKKTTGIICDIIRTPNKTKLTVKYSDHINQFSIDNKVSPRNLNKGDNLIVYYDPSAPRSAYLDLFQINIGQSSFNESSEDLYLSTNLQNSNTVFKLIEINPKFEVNNSLYELVGEIHGGNFQGRKASLIVKLSLDELNNYSPGKLFPCLISGTASDYSIQLQVYE